MSEPLISVIMPVFNVEEYLTDAIESVTCQKYSNLEILVIIDGATDRSLQIANSLAAKDSRIHVFTKDNGGLSDARNYGLKLSKGKYVHFFDSDDIVVDGFYEKMLPEIDNSNLDFVVCGYYKDLVIKDNIINIVEIPICDFNHLDTHLCFKNLPAINFAWNKLFLKDYLVDNNLSFQKGLSVIEDKEFMLRCLRCNPRFKSVNYLGYRYKVRSRKTLSNTFTDDFVNLHIHGIDIQNSIVDILSGQMTSEQLRAIKGRIAFNGIKWIIHSLFSYSNLSFNKKTAIIKNNILGSTAVENIHYYNAKRYDEHLLKHLFMNNAARALSIIYLLRHFFNR